MKTAPFAYERPSSLEGAVELLRAPEAKPLAGGQSLVPMMAMRLVRPALLVDLARVPGLDLIAQEDGYVSIGAMTRQRALERWPGLRSRLPLVASALPFVGHREIRNRGTVGGSLAHADPSAELLLAAATLDGEVRTRGTKRERTLRAAELAVGPFQTRLEPGELLTAVRLPVAREGEGFAFEEVARRHGDFALCGVAVALARSGDRLTRARVGLLGVGPAPQVHDVTEIAGEGGRWSAVGDAIAERLEPSGDMHASAGYRRRLARVLTARCLERAFADAGARAA